MTSFSSARNVSGRSVAILATDGFEDSELLVPFEALQEAGARVEIVSVPDTPRTITGETGGRPGEEVRVDRTLDDVTADDFDALVVPGGARGTDALRESDDVLSFVRDFLASGVPVAAVGQGTRLIAEAGEAAGRTLTSDPTLRDELEDAGADWVDEELVVDGGLLTSGGPADLDHLIDELLDLITSRTYAGERA